MKIIDENGVELTEAPDLTLGRLVDDVEIVHHDAIAGVQQVSHYVPIEHLANGSTIVEEVIDVPGVEPNPAWDEEVPVMRYIRYTAEELAEQAEAKKKAEEAAAAEAKKKAELETVPGRMDALEAANDDLVLMMADLIGG
jgi:hypothetical protein